MAGRVRRVDDAYAGPVYASDGNELVSWRNGASKRALMAFVEQATQGSTAVPVSERIAAFDNDGTLCCEKPTTAFAAFLTARLRRRDGEPAPDVLHDGHRVLALVAAEFAGYSVDDYQAACREFLDNARHPRYHAPYPMLRYQPMRELIDYLRAAQFSVYITSDGSRDFIRTFAQHSYGLAPPAVVGSEASVELHGDRLVRSAHLIEPLADGPGKRVHLWERTGKQPLVAVGNAAGDIEMLECAQFSALLHHDDPVREYAYRDEQALTRAAERGWTVVSMLDDFDVLWPTDQPPT